MPSRTLDKIDFNTRIVPVQKAFSLFTRRSHHRPIHGFRLSSKHDPVGSVIPTMRTQLLTVKDASDAVRLSRASVSSSSKARTRKPLPATARGIGCTSDRDRDRVLLHRVDPGYRNAPPRDELIMRAVAQRISRKSEHCEWLLAAAPSGRQQISATGQEGHQP